MYATPALFYQTHTFFLNVRIKYPSINDGGCFILFVVVVVVVLFHVIFRYVARVGIQLDRDEASKCGFRHFVTGWCLD